MDGAAAPPPMTLAKPMRRLIFVAFSKLLPRNVDNKPLRLRSVSNACVVGDNDNAAACGFSGAIGVGALGARVEKTLLMQNLLYIIVRVHYIYKVEIKQEQTKRRLGRIILPSGWIDCLGYFALRGIGSFVDTRSCGVLL